MPEPAIAVTVRENATVEYLHLSESEYEAWRQAWRRSRANRTGQHFEAKRLWVRPSGGED